MTTLHLIRCSAFENSSIANCLALLAKEDGIVLLDDGVYALQHPLYNKIIAIIPEEKLLLVKTHAIARGLSVPSTCNTIEVSDLVDISLNYTQSITWQ